MAVLNPQRAPTAALMLRVQPLSVNRMLKQQTKLMLTECMQARSSACRMRKQRCLHTAPLQCLPHCGACLKWLPAPL